MLLSPVFKNQDQSAWKYVQLTNTNNTSFRIVFPNVMNNKSFIHNIQHHRLHTCYHLLTPDTFRRTTIEYVNDFLSKFNRIKNANTYCSPGEMSMLFCFFFIFEGTCKYLYIYICVFDIPIF